MPISTGDKLGPYEILALIGKGGMGEVYRARDTRLDRIVAVKVLPSHLAGSSELRERFDREARTIASLSHLHICTLYDIGHQDGTDYLVMEYLEGETLTQRLAKGPLPRDQTLRLATEIAGALDAAHRKGVTHRDLKPGNVMLTKSGAKLLDFGLAKLRHDVRPASGSSQLATLTEAITQHGTILGTPQYMAPEQLEGKEAYARTDIFAFGAVVYEMATGKKPFEGKSQASVIAAILERDPPPIASFQPMSPLALDRIVKKCLAKDPEKRWQAASDVCDALHWISEEGVSGIATSPAPRTGRRWVLVSALACILAAAVAAIAVWLLKPAAPKPVTRFAMSLPPSQVLARVRPAIAISPDGTRLAYAAGQLYLRAMDGLEARAIPGTEGARNPFFSPDGQWLGFYAGGKLKKVALSGGEPVTLGDVAAAAAFGATWSSHGMIAFAGALTSPIQQVSDTGGNPQPLTRLETGEIRHILPEFSPDGVSLLFTMPTGGGSGKVAVQSLKTGERRILLEAGFQPRYAPSGHIVYQQGANLMAAPFDLRRLAVTGAAVPVIEGVLPLQYSFSSTGSLVYVPGFLQAAQLRLVWVDRRGTEQPVPAPPHGYVMPRVSPDGQRVAATIAEADSQIWLYDLGRDTLTRLTFEGSANADPLWTPDGKRITFKGTANRLFWQPADGSGAAEALTSGPLSPNDIPSSWSPDGHGLAFTQDTGNRSI